MAAGEAIGATISAKSGRAAAAEAVEEEVISLELQRATSWA